MAHTIESVRHRSVAAHAVPMSLATGARESSEELIAPSAPYRPTDVQVKHAPQRVRPMLVIES